MRQFNSLPATRLLFSSIVLVAVVPILLLTIHFYYTTKDQSWREIQEKYQLLTKNLASSIESYIGAQRNMLGLLANTLGELSSTTTNSNKYIKQLNLSLVHLDGFQSLAFVDASGQMLALSQINQSEHINKYLFANEPYFLASLEKEHPYLSRIHRSPLTGNPALFLTKPVHDLNKGLVGVLIGELKISPIKSISHNIKFGTQSHAVIVDNHGRVVAHPNTAWMENMQNLSSLSVVQSMRINNTGVTEFYSSHNAKHMVAGYTTIPKFNLGIMVLQPKSELETKIYAMMYPILAWGLVALLITIFLGIFLARRITNPISHLAGSTNALLHNDIQGAIPDTKRSAPKEIHQLSTVLRTLMDWLKKSREEVEELNASLQERVDLATYQLRETNARLFAMASCDHLTSLANRRSFEEILSENLSRRSGDVGTLCIMLIDIDHFKDINDHYGHGAGDAVLSQVARILDGTMRTGDLVARYGGDEFVAQMRCTEEVGMQRAAEIRETIEKYAIQWEDMTIHTTVSVGLYCWDVAEEISVSKLLHEADTAMYKAKKKGRNTVVVRRQPEPA